MKTVRIILLLVIVFLAAAGIYALVRLQGSDEGGGPAELSAVETTTAPAGGEAAP